MLTRPEFLHTCDTQFPVQASVSGGLDACAIDRPSVRPKHLILGRQIHHLAFLPAEADTLRESEGFLGSRVEGRWVNK
jgi:hypothetical protein